MPLKQYPHNVGSADAKRNILFIHGYSGSPDAFIEVAERLAKETDAMVTLPLLPGHHTSVEDLARFNFEDFLFAVQPTARQLAQTGKPLIIVGYCFGGYLATVLAEELKPAALVLTLTALHPRFPFNLPGAAWVLSLRVSWNKYFYAYEIEMRKGFFYYPRIPGRAQTLMNEGISRIRIILPSLTMPIFTMHTSEDPTCYPKSGAHMLDISGHNPKNDSRILPHHRHNLFFGPDKDEDISVLIEFLKKVLE
jgi:carboxylesterase